MQMVQESQQSCFGTFQVALKEVLAQNILWCYVVMLLSLHHPFNLKSLRQLVSS